MIHLQEHEFNMIGYLNSINFLEAISKFNFTKWKHVMEEEIKSMYKNNVWVLEELTTSFKLDVNESSKQKRWLK